MKKLVFDYHSIEKKTFEDITNFHYQFDNYLSFDYV